MTNEDIKQYRKRSIYHTRAEIHHSEITDNVATGLNGGGLYVDNGRVLLTNSISDHQY